MPFESMPQTPAESQRPTRRMSEGELEDIDIDAGIPVPSAPEESGVREKKLSAKEQLGLADPLPSVIRTEPSAEGPTIVARGTMPQESDVAWNKGTVSALGTVPVEGDLDKPPFVRSKSDPDDAAAPRKAA